MMAGQLFAVLRESYDQLPNDWHRLMFLDAALLFQGRPVKHLTSLWEASLLRFGDKYEIDPSPSSNPAELTSEALATLCNQSLVSVDQSSQRCVPPWERSMSGFVIAFSLCVNSSPAPSELVTSCNPACAGFRFTAAW